MVFGIWNWFVDCWQSILWFCGVSNLLLSVIKTVGKTIFLFLFVKLLWFSLKWTGFMFVVAEVFFLRMLGLPLLFDYPNASKDLKEFFFTKERNWNTRTALPGLCGKWNFVSSGGSKMLSDSLFFVALLRSNCGIRKNDGNTGNKFHSYCQVERMIRKLRLFADRTRFIKVFCSFSFFFLSLFSSFWYTCHLSALDPALLCIRRILLASPIS